MNDQIWWYATRAAGLMTWATAMASIALGLLLSFSSRSAGVDRLRLPNRPWLLDLHRFVGALSVVFLVLHLVTLWADSFVHFGWAELFVPGMSEWRPMAVAWGVVSAWLLLAVEASSLAKQWLPARLWHRLHLGSYLVAGFGTVHAVTAGSDTTNPVVRMVGAVLLLVVTGLTLLRVAALRSGPDRVGAADRAGKLDRARRLRDNPSLRRPSLIERLAQAKRERPELFSPPPSSGSGHSEEGVGGSVGREHTRQ